MHQPDQIGPVELATVSFGQSFQITPIQLITTASSLINGGTRITPHIGIRAVRADGQAVHVFAYPKGERILSEQTSETLRYILEQVLSDRRKDGNLGETSKEPEKIYFLIFRVCTGGRSAGDRAHHHR